MQILRRFFSVTLLFSLLTLSFPATAASTFQYIPSKTSATPSWYSPDWKYRIKLTVHHDQVGEDVVGFPMLVKITNNPALFKNAKADGKDIVFTASDGIRKLDHEVETYNADKQELVAWVNVPKLSVTEDTAFYVYYGNENSGDQQESMHVWDGYTSVWHFDSDPSRDEPDSAKNHLDVTPAGGMNANDSLVEGKFGKALKSDGVDDYIAAPRVGYIPYITAQVWVKTTQTNATTYLLARYAGSGNQRAYVMYCANGIPGWGISTDGAGNTFNIDSAGPSIADGQWHQVTGTYDGVNVNLYVDGRQQATTTTNGTIFNAATPLSLISIVNLAMPSQTVDDIRFSPFARSGGWIKTEYRNQSDPDSFYTLGSEEAQTTSSITTPLLFTYSSLNTFKEQATKNNGTILYQLSPDNGKTYYYLKNNTTWIQATKAINASPVDAINKYIKDLPSGTHQLKIKAYLNPAGTLPVVLEALTFTYTPGPATGVTTETPSFLKTGLVTRVNEAFNIVYSRIPTFSEWEYWARRVLNKEKKTFEALVGAIRWQMWNR